VGWEVMKFFLIWLNSSSKRKKTAINISIAWLCPRDGSNQFCQNVTKEIN